MADRSALSSVLGQLTSAPQQMINFCARFSKLMTDNSTVAGRTVVENASQEGQKATEQAQGAASGEAGRKS